MIVPSIELGHEASLAQPAQQADQAELGLLITSVKNSIKKAARN